MVTLQTLLFHKPSVERKPPKLFFAFSKKKLIQAHAFKQERAIEWLAVECNWKLNLFPISSVSQFHVLCKNLWYMKGVSTFKSKNASIKIFSFQKNSRLDHLNKAILTHSSFFFLHFMRFYQNKQSTFNVLIDSLLFVSAHPFIRLIISEFPPQAEN